MNFYDNRKIFTTWTKSRKIRVKWYSLFLKRPKITTLNIEKMKEILEKEYNCENGIYDILKEVEK